MIISRQFKPNTTHCPTNWTQKSTQRTNADVGLADKITAETKARESADSSLSSRINNEVTIRQAADNELQRNIDSEITERQTADTKYFKFSESRRISKKKC